MESRDKSLSLNFCFIIEYLAFFIQYESYLYPFLPKKAGGHQDRVTIKLNSHPTRKGNSWKFVKT